MDPAKRTEKIMNDWAKALSEVLSSQADKVPKEFKTTKELQPLLGTKHTQTARALRKLIDAGRAESKMFRIQTKSGSVRPVAHYRLK